MGLRKRSLGGTERAHHHWCGSLTAKKAVNGTDAINALVAYNFRSPGVSS